MRARRCLEAYGGSTRRWACWAKRHDDVSRQAVDNRIRGLSCSLERRGAVRIGPETSQSPCGQRAHRASNHAGRRDQASLLCREYLLVLLRGHHVSCDWGGTGEIAMRRASEVGAASLRRRRVPGGHVLRCAGRTCSAACSRDGVVTWIEFWPAAPHRAPLDADDAGRRARTASNERRSPIVMPEKERPAQPADLARKFGGDRQTDRLCAWNRLLLPCSSGHHHR